MFLLSRLCVVPAVQNAFGAHTGCWCLVARYAVHHASRHIPRTAPCRGPFRRIFTHRWVSDGLGDSEEGSSVQSAGLAVEHRLRLGAYLVHMPVALICAWIASTCARARGGSSAA